MLTTNKVPFFIKFTSYHKNVLILHAKFSLHRKIDFYPYLFIFLQGLRTATILGCLGTCLGSWIKVFGVDTFYVVFLGQAIVAASQVFILALPTKLAAVWFGPDQVSSACSIGVFGNQVSTCRFQTISSLQPVA